MTNSERLQKAENKKYRIYTYLYGRHNPQIGYHEHTSDVIASTDAEAEKMAKHSCDGTIYGYNTFIRLVAKSDVLPRECYELKIDDWGRDYYHSRPVVVAKRNYSSDAYTEISKTMKNI